MKNENNRVLAVIDDVTGLENAVQELASVGVPARAIAMVSASHEGIGRLSADAEYTGRLTRIVRGRPAFSLEGNQLDRYADEVEHGHNVVDVPVPSRRRRDRIVAVLREHGAHFVNAYGLWTIEQVAA